MRDVNAHLTAVQQYSYVLTYLLTLCLGRSRRSSRWMRWWTRLCFWKSGNRRTASSRILHARWSCVSRLLPTLVASEHLSAADRTSFWRDRPTRKWCCSGPATRLSFGVCFWRTNSQDLSIAYLFVVNIVHQIHRRKSYIEKWCNHEKKQKCEPYTQ